MDIDPTTQLLNRAIEIQSELLQKNHKLEQEIEQLHQLISRLQQHVETTTSMLSTREALSLSTPERRADLNWKPGK